MSSVAGGIRAYFLTLIKPIIDLINKSNTFDYNTPIWGLSTIFDVGWNRGTVNKDI